MIRSNKTSVEEDAIDKSQLQYMTDLHLKVKHGNHQKEDHEEDVAAKFVSRSYGQQDSKEDNEDGKPGHDPMSRLCKLNPRHFVVNKFPNRCTESFVKRELHFMKNYLDTSNRNMIVYNNLPGKSDV